MMKWLHNYNGAMLKQKNELYSETAKNFNGTKQKLQGWKNGKTS